MLFCLNPPHSLPFPHWPDGATLPAAAAADVSLVALAPPAPTSLPRHTAAQRGLSSRGEVAANSRARTALPEPRDSGEGTRARRWQPTAEVEDIGAQNRAEPWRLRLPFSFSAELRRDSGTGPKKDQEILFTARGEEPIEPLFGKSASPAPAAMCSW